MRSPAGLSPRTLEDNCFFMDNFSDADDSTQFYKNDCLKSGLSVDQYMTYETTFTKTATVAMTLAQFQTWSRLLIISPQGISWGSSL